MKSKLAVLEPSFGGKMSNESFITLLMVGVLLILFGIAAVFVPNFYLPRTC